MHVLLVLCVCVSLASAYDRVLASPFNLISSMLIMLCAYPHTRCSLPLHDTMHDHSHDHDHAHVHDTCVDTAA